ncbi:MAG: F0F1 ATP synthase subunit epsilon [Gammaproteobacteria bacterium]
MAMTMHVDIVSAEQEIYSGPAEMVFAPAEMGEVGITPRHTPLLSRLKPGEVRVQSPDGQELFFFVSGGMLEIQPHVVTVLADTALRAKDIDEAAALEAKERAERALADKSSEIEYARAQAELAESIAQLRTLEKLRKKQGRG